MSYVLLVLTTLFWSGNFVVSRGMHSEIPPIALSFWRWTVALLILSLFGLGHFLRQRQLLRRHLGYIVMQGLLGVAGFNSLVYLAVQSTTAINAVLVNSCIPVLIAVFSWLLHRESMTPRQGFGVLVSLAGVVLIISRGDPASLLHFELNRGDLLMLVAALFWALYSTNLKRLPPGLHPLAYLYAIVVAGLVFLLPIYGLELSLGKGFQPTAPALVSILYVALFASVLAFLFWNRAVRSVGANRAGPFIHLMPVFSSILAIVFLGERFFLYHLLGICLIFAGIAMATILVGRR